MIFQPSEFKLLDRGYKETIVLIPGWATDHRVFETLDLKFNYLLSVKFQFSNFKESLLKFLDEQQMRKISLFGWSSGGFLAADFASYAPERVRELVLLSVRKKYPKEDLEGIKGYLKKNKRAYLYKFYLECFSSGETQEFLWFKKTLLTDYVESMKTQDLIKGLEYLSEACIDAGSLKGIERIRIFHGEEDKIAPQEEALAIKSQISYTDFVSFPKTGHLPFLNRQFREKFYG